MGDSRGFDEFYRGTSARMVRYAYALTGDLGDAQDVVQEAYTRAWRHWRAVAAHPAPEAWIRLTVSRLTSDRWRRIGRLRSMLSRSGPPDDVPPPSENTVVLTAALRRLPAHLRQAVTLHYLFDLPVADIATETGAPVGTVTSWLTRGRSQLAELLSESRPGRPLEVTDADRR
jgi:RNA polymerase sigma-70 factor (ECF subfamily)